MVLEHARKKPRRLGTFEKSDEILSHTLGSFLDDTSQTTACLMKPSMEQELLRLCSFQQSATNDNLEYDLSAIRKRLERIGQLIIGEDKRISSRRAIQPCPSPRVKQNKLCHEMIQASRNYLELDQKLVRHIHGFLLLVMSRAVSEYARNCVNEADDNREQSDLMLRAIFNLYCTILLTINHSEFRFHESERDGMNESPSECLEIFEATLRFLRCFLYTHEERLCKQPTCVEDRQQKKETLVTCLRVLIDLGPTAGSLSIAAITALYDACVHDDELRNLMIILFSRLTESHLSRGCQLVKAAHLSMVAPRLDWQRRTENPTLLSMFTLRCSLTAMASPLPESERLDLLKQLAVICIQSRAEAGMAVECLTVLCTRRCLHPSKEQRTFSTVVAQTFTQIIIEADCEMKRLALPALEWHCQQRILDLLECLSEKTIQQRFISSLVQIILSKQESLANLDSLAAIKCLREQNNATKCLLMILAALLDNEKVERDNTAAATAERDYMTIGSVLSEHESYYIVCQTSSWLCDRLSKASIEMVADSPHILAGQGRVIQRFIHREDFDDIRQRILDLWLCLSGRKQQEVRAILARQTSVLSALLKTLTVELISIDAKRSALQTLCSLASDASNRRVMACHNGLIPCLIQATRGNDSLILSSDELDLSSKKLDRNKVKECIMNLAMAL